MKLGVAVRKVGLLIVILALLRSGIVGYLIFGRFRADSDAFSKQNRFLTLEGLSKDEIVSIYGAPHKMFRSKSGHIEYIYGEDCLNLVILSFAIYFNPEGKCIGINYD
jgi:hypothetical protein